MLRKENRMASFSYLRIAATLGVICMHVASTLTDNPGLFPLTDAERLFYMTVAQCFTWCVPCFLMTTGALLLRREKPIGIADCVFKYARRVLLALLVFGLPYGWIMEYAEVGRLSPAQLGNAVLRVISNRSFAHMWYLYVIIGIYLLLPVIRAFTDSCSERALRYVLLILFAFDFVLPTASTLLGIRIAFELPVASCYLFYVLSGHYLFRFRPGWMTRTRAVAAAVLLCLMAIVAAYLTEWRGARAVAPYSSPVTAVCAAGVFALFSRLSGETPTRVLRLDEATFGVYLIHPVFIHLMYRVVGATPTGNLFPLRALIAACGVAVISFAASALLRRIKPLRVYVL